MPDGLPPSAIVGSLAVLAVSQVVYALRRGPARPYLGILAVTAVGFGIGSLWDLVGLPSVRLGGAPVLPGLLIALAMQPLARRLPAPLGPGDVAEAAGTDGRRAPGSRSGP